MQYIVKNKYVTPQLIEDLLDVLKHTRLSHCVKYADVLDARNHLLQLKNGDYATIEDLMCVYGQDAYADACGPVAFYGGPGVAGRDGTFTFMQGTVLTWMLDLILYEVSQYGYGIFRELDL